MPEQASNVSGAALERLRCQFAVAAITGIEAKRDIALAPVRKHPALPLTAQFGLLGHIDLTAYFGLLDIGKPKAGETLVVTGAAGAVGSLAGQIGKIMGCRVVGIAGTDEKCRWITDTLGFDAAVNYRTELLAESLKMQCPGGVDIDFENVGGEALSESLAQEMKPFNVRVAIVEPSVVETPMVRRLAAPHSPSPYPQQRRFAALYAATLKNPTPPSVVAEKILEIAESHTWQLRHPVGPAVEAFFEMRLRMSDEEWVDWGALDDAAWYDCMKTDLGMDLRPEA